MPIYEDAGRLSAHLNDKGFDSAVIDGQVVTVDLPGSEYFATIRISGGWLVLKLFVADFGTRCSPTAMQNLLHINDRLTGFRFALDNQEVCLLQDFPLKILNNCFEVYLNHLAAVLEAILPSLRDYLKDDIVMTDDDIDALFDRLNGSTH